jgi:hypothetical protein
LDNEQFDVFQIYLGKLEFRRRRSEKNRFLLMTERRAWEGKIPNEMASQFGRLLIVESEGVNVGGQLGCFR